MLNIQEILDFADNSCRASGRRLTQKRRLVLTALLQSPKPLSAYELITYCQQQFSLTLPAISVYRILNFLQEGHFVHKLNSSQKYIARTLTNDCVDQYAPQFLICYSCGNAMEVTINDRVIQQLKQQVEQTGYLLQSPKLEMHCLCHECIKKT